MEGNQIIMRGERGLYLSDGKKIYFPDRSFLTATTGFVKNVKVVKDKGTYAFVTGEMVHDLIMDVDALAKRLYTQSKEMIYVHANRADALVVHTHSDRWKVYVGGEEFCEVSEPQAIRWLMFRGRRIDLVREEVLSWLSDDAVTDDAVMIMLVKLLRNPKSASNVYAVWGNKVINQSGSPCFIRCNNMKGRDEEWVGCSAKDSLVRELGDIDHVYGEEEIVSFAKKNNIALVGYGDRDGTVSKRFRYMDSYYDLKMFGGCKLNETTLHDPKLSKEVSDSVSGFEVWLKQCGRCTTSKNVGLLSRLMSDVKDWRGY